jgi:hypothetical protein
VRWVEEETKLVLEEVMVQECARIEDELDVCEGVEGVEELG